MKVTFETYNDADLFYMLTGDSNIAEKAFTELYSRHSSRVYAYCRRFLGDKEEARDIFQETFVKFFQSAHDKRIMTNVPGFLLKIARNLCVNSVKRIQKNVSYEDYMASDNANRMENNELLNLIKMALELLPKDYKEIFILREYNGLSYDEISETVNIPMATVKVRIHRAKQKIREILNPFFVDLEKN